MQTSKPKRKFAFLLIAAALATLGLKFFSYYLSNSVGLLSDAAESVVNLSAAISALLALTYAAKPADRDHPYGHEKIEFFASGLEGALIIVAAILIVFEAIHRFLYPKPLDNIAISLGVALFAALINGMVAQLLLSAASRHDSIVLESSARHLVADVWTTAGVAVGLILFMFTHRAWLDPLLALAVGVHVVWSGVELVRRSFQGLMDAGLPEVEIKKIKEIIHKDLGSDWKFHALRTRKSGSRRFVDFHLLMPGKFSLAKAHEIASKLEHDLESAFEEMDATIHMEPLEDPKSWEEDSISRRI